MYCQVDLGGWKKKESVLETVGRQLTVKQVSAFVQVYLKVGALDVELEVLLHRVDVVEDVLDDPEIVG